MSQEAAKKTTKPKVGKPPAAESAPAKAPAPKKAEAPKAAEKKAAPKAQASGAKVKVTQMVGSIARKGDQRATLIGLGLNKRHRSRVLVDTPEVRGMIYKVRHLVKVEQA